MTTLKYSRINQAYFLMFHQTVIEVFDTLQEATFHLSENGLGTDAKGTVMKLDKI